MKAIASIPNWHRYLLVFLGGLGAILLGLQADPSILPATLSFIVPYERLAILLILVATGVTPTFLHPTGPGAPPILSPPPPGIKTVPLVEKWVPPTS